MLCHTYKGMTNFIVYQLYFLMWGSMSTNKLDEENIFTVYLLLPEVAMAPYAKLG